MLCAHESARQTRAAISCIEEEEIERGFSGWQDDRMHWITILRYPAILRIRVTLEFD